MFWLTYAINGGVQILVSLIIFIWFVCDSYKWDANVTSKLQPPSTSPYTYDMNPVRPRKQPDDATLPLLTIATDQSALNAPLNARRHTRARFAVGGPMG